MAQVGAAVGQIDKATRRNAALDEASAAAAVSLKDQARQLVQVVAVFKLGHCGAAQGLAAAAQPPAHAPAASARPRGRRSPNRARNVVRQSFKPPPPGPTPLAWRQRPGRRTAAPTIGSHSQAQRGVTRGHAVALTGALRQRRLDAGLGVRRLDGSVASPASLRPP